MARIHQLQAVDWGDYVKDQLPRSVVPSHYDLLLTPNLAVDGDHKFSGHVDIKVEVVEDGVRDIVFNTKQLQIERFVLHRDDDSEDASNGQETTVIEFEAEKTYCTARFGEVIARGSYIISIDFVGEHNDEKYGFYRTAYTDPEGNNKIMVNTNCEPIDARRYFPCFDEPHFKATFAASLIVPTGIDALSNMPEVSRVKENDNQERVSFEKTPLMSSYLLCFCVGEFDHVEQVMENEAKTLVRIFTMQGKGHKANFALDVVCRCLAVYEEFFGVPYTLPKCDVIGLTNLEPSAMENWGLITQREAELLVDETTSPHQVERIAEVLAHELAHQWFGNLVTLKWWDDLWLNEGFASWLEIYCIDKVFPEWNFWASYSNSTLVSAMRNDNTPFSRTVRTNIDHDREARKIFDSVTYSKGACVVHLLYTYLGEELFKQGLHEYIETNQFGNVETKDLCQVLSDVAGEDLSIMLQQWVLQQGHPYVLVDRGTGSNVVVKQMRRIQGLGMYNMGEDTTLWRFPLIYQTPAGINRIQFNSRERNLTPDATRDEYFLVNAGQHIEMSVRYSHELWLQLVETIKGTPDAIAAVDKAALVRNSLISMFSGELGTVVVFQLVEAVMSGTSDYYCWKESSDTLDYLVNEVKSDEAALAQMQRMVGTLVNPKFAELGWDPNEGESHNDAKVRGILFPLMGKFKCGDEAFMTEAEQRFQDFIRNPESENANQILPSSIRSKLFQLLLSDEGKATDTLDALMGYLATLPPNECTSLAFEVGHVAGDENKIRVLQWALDTFPEPHGFQAAFAGVCSTSATHNVVGFTFLSANLDLIVAKAKTESDESDMLDNMLSWATSTFRTGEHAEMLKTFLEDQDEELKLKHAELIMILKFGIPDQPLDPEVAQFLAQY